MNFEKIVVMVGTEEIMGRKIENDQLLIGCTYITFQYQEGNDHNQFLEEIATEFADRIVESGSSSLVGTLNGHKINEISGKITKIQRLEHELFQDILTRKICQSAKGRAATMSIAETN